MVESDLEAYYPKNDGSQVEVPSDLDLQQLEKHLGAEALHYLQTKTKIYKEVSPVPNFYTEIKFVANYEGRLIEIGIGNTGAVDMHFSDVTDYATSKTDKYEKVYGEAEFGSSLKFMRFMDELFSKVNKNIRLIVFGANGKRGRLFEERLKHHGLTNAFVGSFVD